METCAPQHQTTDCSATGCIWTPDVEVYVLDNIDGQHRLSTRIVASIFHVSHLSVRRTSRTTTIPVQTDFQPRIRFAQWFL